MAYSHEILVAAPALLVLSRVSFMIAQIEMGGMTVFPTIYMNPSCLSPFFV